jgi:hypothetical protein
MSTPLDPQDPLWPLLGKAKSVPVRPNFSQNMARCARQTAQERGLWAAWRAWFRELDSIQLAGRLAAATAVVLLSVSGYIWLQPAGTSAPQTVAAVERAAGPAAEWLADEVLPESELAQLDEIHALLTVDDTSLLTDQELQVLLYE